jgi:hypothetical protein
MHAHPAEVVAESGLEEITGAGVKGLAGGLKDLVHDGRHRRASAIGGGTALRGKALGVAGGALSVGARRAPAGAFRGKATGLRGGNHLRRHAVRFLFVEVVGLADRKLRLDAGGRSGTKW